MRYIFKLRFHAHAGQSLWLNHPLLGNGDVAQAFPLEYLNADFWEGIVEFSESPEAH